MESDWRIYRIKDVASFVVDNRGKTPPTQDDGYMLLEVNAVSATEKFPQYQEVRKHVSQEVYNSRFRKGHPRKGDILVPTVGTLGAVSLMDRDDCCIAQNLIAIRCNEERCHSHFLYYVLCNPMTRKRLLNLNIGGVQPSIKVPHLMDLEIELPSIGEQKKIAEILSSLDDKICCNRRINDNLLKQMQLLYFNLLNSCECSQVRLEDVSQKIAMGPFGSNIKVSTFVPEGVPIISGSHLRSVFLEEPSYNYITEEHAQRLKNSIVYPRDIVFTHAGNIGQVAMIPEGCDFPYYMISQRQFYMRCDESKVIPEFVFYQSLL